MLTISLSARLMDLRQKLALWLIPLLITSLVRLVSATVRFRVIGEDPVMDRGARGLPTILVSWHGRTLLPTWYFGPRHWVAMISLSRDGEFQARIFRRFGWEIVRGSSGRGGIRALVGAVKRLRAGATLAFTPDGPRGPSHLVHPGVLFLSRKSGAPIYPVGLSAFPRFFLPTWDRYLIPAPFSRAVMLYGDPVHVPPEADEAALQEIARDLAERICHLEERAEAMVTPPRRRITSGPASEHPPRRTEPFA